MEMAYEGNETRQVTLDLGFIPVVLSSERKVGPWEYGCEMYKRHNEVERQSRCLKGFRCILSRFE